MHIGQVIYALRREIMVEADLDPVMDEFMNDVLDDVYGSIENVPVDDQDGLRQAAFARLRDVFNLDRVLPENARLPEREECAPLVHKILGSLKAETGDSYRDIQRYFMLEELDRSWKEHLRNMDALRDGIGLRGYGQRDPKLEYKREGFEMFQAMLFQIRESVFRALTRVRVRIEPGVQRNTSEVYVVSAERPAGSTANVDFTNRSVNTGVDSALVDEMLASMSRISEKGGSVSLLAARDYDTPSRVSLTEDGSGNVVLNLGEDLDRAWASVGRALEQGPWRVEDINRSLGLYYINLAEKAEKKDEKPGFFSGLFGGKPSKEEVEARAQRYQVRLSKVGDSVQVTVEENINKSASPEVARKVLGVIQDNLG